MSAVTVGRALARVICPTCSAHFWRWDLTLGIMESGRTIAEYEDYNQRRCWLPPESLNLITLAQSYRTL